MPVEISEVELEGEVFLVAAAGPVDELRRRGVIDEVEGCCQQARLRGVCV